MSWNFLSKIPANHMVQARLQLHHAVQIPAIIARSYLGKHPEDIHANLGWDSKHKALISNSISASGKTVQVGIQLESLTVIVASKVEVQSFPLDKRSWEEGLDWVMEILQNQGFPTDNLDQDQPYGNDLPDFTRELGALFTFGNTSAFSAIASFFANSDFLIKEVLAEIPEASSIRCWPHHFDIASLISYDGGKSIGIGLSPGDATSPLPYYYINMWPYPALSKTELPALQSGGTWHTEGWTGAILGADELWEADDQGKKVDSFLQEAFAHAKSLIS